MFFSQNSTIKQQKRASCCSLFFVSLLFVLRLVAAEEEDTAEQATENKYANAHSCGGLAFLHLIESDDAENKGENCPKLANHTDDNEYLC